jgi:hypothetical protein
MNSKLILFFLIFFAVNHLSAQQQGKDSLPDYMK